MHTCTTPNIASSQTIYVFGVHVYCKTPSPWAINNLAIASLQALRNRVQELEEEEKAKAELELKLHATEEANAVLRFEMETRLQAEKHLHQHQLEQEKEKLTAAVEDLASKLEQVTQLNL